MFPCHHLKTLLTLMKNVFWTCRKSHCINLYILSKSRSFSTYNLLGKTFKHNEVLMTIKSLLITKMRENTCTYKNKVSNYFFLV